MMPADKLVRLVLQNTVRSPRHFFLSAFGIVFGIGAFVFLLAFSAAASQLISKVFPIEQVEVRAPHASLLGKDISKKLDDSVVAMIKQRPEVAEALPRMNLVFPASGFGTFDTEELNFEVGGFADGIDPVFVQDDPRLAAQFKDWDGIETNRQACVPPSRWEDDVPAPAPEPAPAGSDAGSGSGSGSASGSGSSTAAAAATATAAGSGAGTGTGSAAAPSPAAPAPSVAQQANAARHRKRRSLTSNGCADPSLYYCDTSDRTCHHRVPIVVSPTLVEFYNTQFAPSHGLPQIGELEQFVAQRGGFGAMSFEIGLGDTMVAGSNDIIDPSKRRRVQAVVVGISPKALPLGMTMPIQYVRKWNQEFVGDDAAKQYPKIIVTLRDKDRLAVFNQWIMDSGLRIEDSLAGPFATAIFIITIIFFAVSLIIVFISAINIAHNFFMQVSDRRREIGIMRAVGATRGDVLLIVLGEAAVIGIIGGLLGVVGAMAIATGIDWMFVHWVPKFPFKPNSVFSFRWYIVLGGMTMSTVFCVLGGWLPARKAARLEPAQALAAQ